MEPITGPGFRTVRGYQLTSQRKDGLTPALEDYLEMAYRLCLENHYTRVGKLSEQLHVRPSSTSKMINKLADIGYLEYDLNDSISLTEKGRKIGAYLLKRHDISERFLRLIGNASPLEEAELIEHSLSSSTVSQINILLDFFAENPAVRRQYDHFIRSKAPKAKGLQE